MKSLYSNDTYSEDMRGLILKDGRYLPFKVLKSATGYYIGTWDGEPYSRESQRYWNKREDAQKALDTGNWIPIT